MFVGTNVILPPTGSGRDDANRIVSGEEGVVASANKRWIWMDSP